MSARNQDILHQLIVERNIDENKLKDQLQISARQLNYRISQINEQLTEFGIPIIEKRKGRYYCSNQAIELLYSKRKIKEIVFPVEDRIQIILLLILGREEEISLDHLSIELQVSKNTILSDIKKSKEFLEKHELIMEYSRKKGYYIQGEEWHKRMALSNAITTLYRKYGENILDQLLEGYNENKLIVKESVLQIEKYLSIKYTDEDFYPLIYFISVTLGRINRGQLVDDLYLIDPKEIANTKEYQSLIYLFNDFPEIPETERLYTSLQLLGSNVRNKRPLKEEDLPALGNSLWEFLTKFEANTFLVLGDKKELLRKLMNHFKPAYYRIKYNLSFENVLYEQIISKYHVLHDFVRQSIRPLEIFFQTEIADQEIAYITLFVGGHLLENDQNDFEEKVIKAVILCPNGVSMSKLMEKNLKTLFPEFLFYPANSVRDYEGFVLPHDIVFSTVPVKSDKEVYVVNELITKHEQLKLRRQVIKDTFKLDFDTLTSSDILNVVKKYAKIPDEKNLSEALDSLLVRETSNLNDALGEADPQNLSSILTKETIQIFEEEKEWEESLTEAGQLLIDKGKVGKDYVRLLLDEYYDMPDYIMVKQRILLPHLDPNRISQKLGVSILVLKKGLKYQERRIYVIALLTTPDKTSHLNILFDINRMAKDESFINKLKNVDTAEQAQKSIYQFLESKEEN